MDNNIDIKFYTREPEDVPLEYVVIAAKKDGRWIFVRHKSRRTYEIPGGHIEQGEGAVDAAKRELYEETGATEFTLSLVSVYTVVKQQKISGGYLFFAEINEMSNLPEYEIAERVMLGTIPKNLTYPNIQTALYNKVQRWLNTQSCKNELWDVYDKDRKLTGRTQRRGDPLPDGDFHLVVHVWIQNSNNEFLITRRSPNKGYPYMWECTGGAAVTGDTSRDAAIREVQEETGLSVLPENGAFLFTDTYENNYRDVWLFRYDFDMRDIVLQEGETCDAKQVTASEIKEMINAGEFMDFDYMDDLFAVLDIPLADE